MTATDEDVLDKKKVVSISSVQTDLIKNNFSENLTLLTVLHHDDYHNTFTKQPNKCSVKAAVSFNFDWSRSLVLPSVKDCTVL